MMQKKHRIHSLQRVRLVETDRICTVVWAAEGKGNGTAWYPRRNACVKGWQCDGIVQSGFEEESNKVVPQIYFVDLSLVR